MAKIFREFMSPACEKQVATAVDVEIRRIIENYPEEEWEKKIPYDGKWGIFLNFASVRKNALYWYQFRKNAEVLEIDSGNGALTGLLCEKCGHVTTVIFSSYRAETVLKRYKNKKNLDIYVGAVGTIEFKKKFDYIVLIGNLEGIPKEKRNNYLKILMNLLKPGGIILCAVDNRYALRYLCGAREFHTGRPYDGLNGYRAESRGYSFDRKELAELFEKVGFHYNNFYYLLPDYLVTQAVFSDRILPNDDIIEQIYASYWGYDTLKADEDHIYRDVIRNAVFPFFAPAFMIECSRESIEEQNVNVELPFRAIPFQHKNFEVKQKSVSKILADIGKKGMEIQCQEDEILNLSKFDLDKLESVRKIQMDIYQEFSRICKKYDLSFFVFSGTLLGAVRHEGYIPWDDDMDLIMPRQDFEKFKRIVGRELKEPYYWENSRKDSDFFGGSMSRIRNTNTTGIQSEEIGRKGTFGIWVDILVLDNLYVENTKKERQLKRLSFWATLALQKTYPDKENSTVQEKKWKKLEYFSRIIPRKVILNRFDAACKCCPDSKTNIYSIYNRNIVRGKFAVYNKEYFEKTIEKKFENLNVPLPEEYDNILKKMFGKKYMKYPKSEERISKHNGIMDADLPYWRFSKVWSNELSKEVIALGDERLIDLFRKKYGAEKKIIYLADVSDKLKNADEDKDIIICTDMYMPYVEQMVKKKINNFYIFVSDEI